MNKTWIIIQREFSVRVKKKSFIFLTILMPFLIVGIIAVPALLGQMSSSDTQKVAVIDKTGKYFAEFKSTEDLQFTAESEMKDIFKSEDSPYDAVVQIDSDLTRSESGAAIFSKKEVTLQLERYVNNQLSEKIRTDRLSAYQIEDIDKVIKDADVNYSIKTVRWTDDGGTKASSSALAAMIGLVLSLFIYMFILSYGGMVMQGVMEEKTNRIVEIMVSSVKPHQLMFGKITAVALVGLFQFLIWILMIAGILSICSVVFGFSMGGADALAATGTNLPEMPDNPGMEFLQFVQGVAWGKILVCYLLYFIGGYLLFAALFAAIGASVNESQDSQQFMMPIILIFVFALYAGMFSMENTDGPLALWCSFIPFTSPIVMMVRLPFDIPIWQVVLSLAILYATAFAIVWVSAKIYRIGILMYGKKPTFKDMLKWVKASN